MKYSLGFEIPLAGAQPSFAPTPYCAAPPQSR